MWCQHAASKTDPLNSPASTTTTNIDWYWYSAYMPRLGHKNASGDNLLLDLQPSCQISSSRCRIPPKRCQILATQWEVYTPQDLTQLTHESPSVDSPRTMHIIWYHYSAENGQGHKHVTRIKLSYWMIISVQTTNKSWPRLVVLKTVLRITLRRGFMLK